MCIQRALRRNFLLTASTIDGSGSQPTLQLTFAPGATDYRINGVSVYTTALPNSAEFSNLFDQYRLKSVCVRVDMAPNLGNSALTPLFMPNCYYIADYDDGGDALITDMLQYPQVQLHNFWSNGYTPLMVKLNPRPLMTVSGSGISSGYSPSQTAPWIRTADMTIPHYGLKLAFDFLGQTQTASTAAVVTIWYELEFTNPK